MFTNLPIEDNLLKAIERCGYEEMTDVQELVIPVALEGYDIIAQAPTGTGKTCAYGLPILEKIDLNNNNIQVLILSPTRELALQITEDLRDFAYFKEGVRICALYGGEYIEKQITALKKRPQIIVATPGRLMDHMERRTVRLDNIQTVILDEADEMLDMGFREDIDTILSHVKDGEHQTMLFSATFSPEIQKITKDYLHEPKEIKVSRKELTLSNIHQQYVVVREQDKVEVISRVIDINGYELAMIFCNTKKTVDEVTSGLLQRGFVAEALHGDMKQEQRERVMNRFKAKQINILVASDVAARGLDIDDVDVVFNYNLPQEEEYYVHRIGRTGRAKKEGVAISLLSNQEKYKLKHIMNYTKAPIEAVKVPSLDKVIKSRVERIINGAKEVTTESVNNKYFKAIRNAIYELASEDISTEEIITGLILQQMNIDNDAEVVEQNESLERTNSSRRKDVIRFFINRGRKDHMKLYNLTDMIVERTNLTNADINNVDVHDEYSFFEVPKKYENEIYSAFNRKEKDGRTITVEESHPREKTGKGKTRGGVGRHRRGDSEGSKSNSSSRKERSSKSNDRRLRSKDSSREKQTTGRRSRDRRKK